MQNLKYISFKCPTCDAKLASTNYAHRSEVPVQGVIVRCCECTADIFLSPTTIEPYEVFAKRFNDEENKRLAIIEEQRKENEQRQKIAIQTQEKAIKEGEWDTWSIIVASFFGLLFTVVGIGYSIEKFNEWTKDEPQKETYQATSTQQYDPSVSQPMPVTAPAKQVPTPNTIQNTCDLEVPEEQLMNKVEELGYKFLEYDAIPDNKNNDECTIMYRCIVNKVDFEGNVTGTFRLMPTFKKFGGEFQVMSVLLYSYSTGAITQIY